jgi:hypothetical protein
VDHDEQLLVVGERLGEGLLQAQQLRDAEIPPVGELLSLVPRLVP